jgi:hypothetical protein
VATPIEVDRFELWSAVLSARKRAQKPVERDAVLGLPFQAPSSSRFGSGELVTESNRRPSEPLHNAFTWKLSEPPYNPTLLLHSHVRSAATLSRIEPASVWGWKNHHFPSPWRCLPTCMDALCLRLK